MIHQIALTLLVAFSAMTGWKEHVDSAKRLKFNYPDTWTQQDVGDMAISFLSPAESDSDMFQENINLVMQDLTAQPMELETYTTLTAQQITDYLGADAILSVKDATVGKQKAKELIYAMDYEGLKLKLKQFLFIKDNIAYIFTFSAEPQKFEQYQGTATEAIQSLAFIP